MSYVRQWLRRCLCWILSFDPGLKHWWTWLSATGFDPVLPPLIVRYENNSRSMIVGSEGRILIQSPDLGDLSTSMVWQSTWFAMIRTGSERSGGPGGDSGHLAMLCILVPTSCNPP